MSFGKRKFEESGKRSASDYDNYARSSFSPAQIGLSIAGILVVSAVVFTGTFFVARAGYLQGGPSHTVLEGYFDKEPTPVARIYEKAKHESGNHFGGVHGDFKIEVARTETGFSAIDSELHERCLRRLFPKKEGDPFLLGYFGVSPHQSVKYLTCTMRIFKSRFCEAPYRERLAGRINDTIRAYLEAQAYRKDLSTAHTADGLAYRQFQVHNELIGGSRYEGVDLDGRQIPLISEDMAAELGNLSVYGLLRVEDFETAFSAAPAEILPYLREQEYQVCS